MKRYTYFHGLILSFFSKSFYQDVGMNWKGIGYLYIAVILALLWIPSVIKVQRELSRFVDKDSVAITKQIPPIKIRNGVVSTDVPQPYVITNPADGTPAAIIDTTGKYKTLEGTPARMLVTRNTVVAKSNTDTRIYDLTNVQSFDVDRERVEGWFQMGKQWFLIAFYPLALLFSFIFRAIQILVYALIGLAFANMLHTQLDYKTLMRLAAVAITPVLVIDLFMDFSRVGIPFWSIVGIGIGLGYLFFAIKANGEVEPAPEYYPPPPPVQP
ncbi:MAG TPA: DUF1189 family protein [Pyrinomonadaceae bacterium]|nr:DUF1189 family protein [Pyrinomonadaceae bacterium]